MMAQVLFFDVFSEKDSHLNAVELISISLIQGTKKLLTVMTPAVMLLSLSAANLIFRGKQRLTF